MRAINYKKYFIRLIVFNFFGLIYLIDTNSFDQGFISLQSIFYSLNIYIYYFFIFFESLASLISSYGLDFSFLDLVFKNIGHINYKYIFFLFYRNINFVYFILFSFVLIYFFEKNNYKINLYNKSFKKNLILLFFVVLFILSNFNPNLTHHRFIERYKGLLNSWTSEDLVFIDTFYYKKFAKNNFLRNDNWYITIKFSYFYKNTNSAGGNMVSKVFNNESNEGFKMFEKILLSEEYNNVFVIINESYPNFRDFKLKNNLLDAIISGHDNLNVRNFKKDWNRKLATLGAELDLFCGKNLNYKDFKDQELKIFLKNNKCWINSQQNKNLVYIHSYDERFYDRTRYKSFFDKTFFRKDLEKINFQVCDQYFKGICDHDVLDNIEKLMPTKDNNFVIFLTINNHIPTSKFYKKPYIDCEKNFPLNLSSQFCDIYNNQMLFNESISRLISRISKNDLLILFSDTPPIFRNKHKVHFENMIDVYFISNK